MTDKDRYIQAWTYHIDQLSILAIAGRIDYDTYRKMKVELNHWLDEAIFHLYTTKGTQHE